MEGGMADGGMEGTMERWMWWWRGWEIEGMEMDSERWREGRESVQEGE